jgi:signal transduction histidine kinase
VVAASGLEPPDGALQPRQVSVDVRVLRAVDGTPVDAVIVPVGGGLWMAAIRNFADARAFELRRLLVGDEVVLVHAGQVVGRTSGELEGLDAALADTEQTTVVALAGARALIGFTPVGPDSHVGVVTVEPLQGLGRDLTAGRIVALLGLAVLTLLGGNALLRLITRPLKELTDTAEAVRRGEPGQRFVVQTDDEIGQLAETLESMRTALAEQLGLISVQADAIQRATQRIVTARDTERRRMAQDLHDGVQQELVMLRLRISLLETLSAPEREALAADVESAITRVRETSQAIFPSILADRGLSGALWSLAGSAPLRVDLDLRPDPLPRLAEVVEAAAYFIVSEALANATKHAATDRVRISARARPDSLLVVVADHGAGFDAAGRGTGSGLQNLRDRALALGGDATVRSRPGVGTAVVARLPLDVSVGRALQEEQHGGDAAVEVVGVAEAELAEDGVGVLLDRALGDDEPLRDR